MDHILPFPAPRRRPGLRARLREARALRRQRSRLRDLDDHLLKDIGVSCDAAEREASRPLWDVPPHWRA